MPEITADFSKKTPLGKAYESTVDAGETPSPEQIDGIRSILAEYDEVHAAISEAAACDQYASKLDFSLPHRQFLAAAHNSWGDLRTVARFMVWQMEVAVADGKHDQAVDKGVQLLQLTRLHNAEPSLAASMIGFAVRGVAAQKIYEAMSDGPVSAEVRQRLEAELDSFENNPGFLDTLKSERALNISGVQEHFSGLRGLLNGWPPWAPAELLDYFEQIFPLVGLTWHRVQTTPSARGALNGGQGWVVGLMRPAIEAWLKAANRTTAIMRSLRVYNKLSTHRQGVSNESVELDGLGLPKLATLDPFSGVPLVVTRIEDGWMVYSVGENGVDDGGSFEDQQDWGLGPRKKAAE